jgi:hypothetical protein
MRRYGAVSDGPEGKNVMISTLTIKYVSSRDKTEKKRGRGLGDKGCGLSGA